MSFSPAALEFDAQAIQLMQKLAAIGDADTGPSKLYKAIWKQDGAAAPTAEVLVNTFGVAINPGRVGVGHYSATAASGTPFTVNKSFMRVSWGLPTGDAERITDVWRQTDSEMRFRSTTDAGVAADEWDMVVVTIEVWL